MRILLLLSFMLFYMPSHGAASHPDTVDVYIVPMDDFPEDKAAEIANLMAEDMRLWVKSSVRLGNLYANKLPGTNQLMAEDIIEKSQPVIKKLGNITEKTYFLILTTRDINLGAGNLRFVFASHNKAYNTSVISLQRMVNYVNGVPVFDEISQSRLYKMMKRSIGEMQFGWQRTTDINDIMYAPIMSLDDLDKMGLQHREEKAEEPATDTKLPI
jgi:predicted Zn-dependent protease